MSTNDCLTRRATRLAQATASWLVRMLLVFTLAITLARRGAIAAPPQPTLLAQPPALHVQTERRVPANDLSAAVRVHRAGRTLDVWLVTPHSAHWEALAAAALPLHQQLAALRWPLALGKRPKVAPRFEPLPRGMLPRTPRLLRAR